MVYVGEILPSEKPKDEDVDMQSHKPSSVLGS